MKNFLRRLNKFTKTWAGAYLLFIFINWCACFLFRIVFLIIFNSGLKEGAASLLPQAFYTGAKFDLRLACAASVLFGLFLFVNSIYPLGKTVKKCFAALSALIFTSVIYIYVLDIGHYAYLTLRVNATVFKYLEDAAISARMVWESYPVVWISLALLAALYGAYRLVLFLINRVNFAREKWWALTLKFFGLFLLTGGMMYGQIALFPLRWSNAYFSSDQFISNLTLNPILNIYDTYKFTAAASYDADALAQNYAAVAQYLGVDKPDQETLNLERKFPAKQVPGTGYNVVLIFMESFAWNKVSMSGGPLDATPFAAALSKESVLFNNFYTPTAATARAVFATLTSIPDTSSFKTNSRNPLIVNQHMIANDFDGYARYYFIGGSASWGNIRGMIQNNLDGLKLYEEDSYDKGNSTDVWGVSDLALFRFSARELAKEKKPFFAVIQTAGFHRPYTIPKDNDGFEVVEVDQETLEKHSYHHIEEYNSLRFSDHALKKFFDLVKEEDYYDNTIFVIFGDHGLSMPYAANMPPGVQAYDLMNHQVPLIIHAPKILRPQVIDTAASQVDIMPTVAGLIGAEYSTRAMGRDLFGEHYRRNPGAFLYGFTFYPPTINFLRGDLLYYSRGEQEGLYKYASDDYQQNIAPAEPKNYNEMKGLAHGLYEAARFMIFNNKEKNK